MELGLGGLRGEARDVDGVASGHCGWDVVRCVECEMGREGTKDAAQVGYERTGASERDATLRWRIAGRDGRKRGCAA